MSLEQVTDIINGKQVLGAPKEIREVQNAYEAYERVFRMNPYSLEDFLEAHKLLTDDLVKESGCFRSGDVGVYDGAGNVVHIGARPQFVHQLMRELFERAEQDDTPDLIKSCVVHFEIEMIHPFPDGNGRMGRLWQNLILSKWQQVFEWIPIETIIYENQPKYYEMLAIGDKVNDSTEFIEFMLVVICDTVSQFKNSKVIDKLSDKVSDKMDDKEIAFFNIIYPYLSENHEIGSRKAAELSGKPSATVRRYLVKLVELGILRSAGENKNRTYYLSEEK
ncbi:Fic family protein [Lactovum odontotermitis]